MSDKNDAVSYRRELEVRHHVDVLVAGGGPGGIAAALAAARQGCSVRLIEAQTCLGGLGTAGMVPVFQHFTDGVNVLAAGIGQEILDCLREAGGTYPAGGMGIRPEVLKLVYDRLLTGAGIGFSFHTQVIDVLADDGMAKVAICAGKSGLFAIEAGAFVDGTGDGDLAAFAGAPFEKGDADGKAMPGTLCSLWAGIDWEKVREHGQWSDERRLEDAIADGVFTLEDRHLPGMYRIGDTIGGGNIGHTFDVDGTDEDSITKGCLWGRKSLAEYERYYKEYLVGFEEMELLWTAPLLGVRESRRIEGDYVLCVDDFNKDSVFDDEIGRFSYPVDIHIASPDRESYDEYFKDFTSYRLGHGESYGIPYRILTAKGLANVLVAGRCVSTDRQMQSSIRVMPGCYITGQAAGVAAAMIVAGKTDSRGISVKELQTRLAAIGAFLPNFGGE